MNLKRTPAEPPAEPEYEGMAAELNPRGMPYVYLGKTFPPGEWIAITQSEATALRWFGAITTRVKEAL